MTVDRWHIPSSEPRFRRAVTDLCAAFLIFYLATVHAQHIPASDSSMALDLLNVHVTHDLGDRVSAMQASMGMDGMDCPFPSLLMPRVESMPDVASALAWWLPILAIVCILPRLAPVAVSLPRPTGPSRQALLQRFLL